jgi:hypothetical protein
LVDRWAGAFTIERGTDEERVIQIHAHSGHKALGDEALDRGLRDDRFRGVRDDRPRDENDPGGYLICWVTITGVFSTPTGDSPSLASTAAGLTWLGKQYTPEQLPSLASTAG